MSLKVLTLFTGQDGSVQHADREVNFRHGDSGLAQTCAGLSSWQKCRNCLFIELVPGFKSSEPIADFAQLAVCLSGQLELTLNDNSTRNIGPGDVMQLDRETHSRHELCVLGSEPVYLLMVFMED